MLKDNDLYYNSLLNRIRISDCTSFVRFLKEGITLPLGLHSLAQLIIFPKFMSLPSYVQPFGMGSRNSTISTSFCRHKHLGLAHADMSLLLESTSDPMISSISVLHQLVIFTRRILKIMHARIGDKRLRLHVKV